MVPAAAGDGLRLDRHADAVVLAVLVFAHLGEGLWIVEVGVRIEDVEHARDGAVVDGLVGLVGGQLLRVVLLDEGVDAGEGVQAVTEGGLIRRGLGGDLLVDERTEKGAGCEEKGGGEECAAGAGSHGLGLPRRGKTAHYGRR